MQFEIPGLGTVTLKRYGQAGKTEYGEPVYRWRVKAVDEDGTQWARRLTATHNPTNVMARACELIAQKIGNQVHGYENAYHWSRMAQLIRQNEVQIGHYATRPLWYRTAPFSYDSDGQVFFTREALSRSVLETLPNEPGQLVFVYANDLDVPQWVCYIGPRGGINWTKC